MTAPASPRQCLTALAEANRIRLRRAAICRAIARGEMTVGAALYRVECRTMSVVDLLCAQRRWGAVRAAKLLEAPELGVSESKKVGDLTARQRRQLVAMLNGDQREAAA